MHGRQISYGCVEPDQIAWYQNESIALRKTHSGTPVPGVSFLHIPPPEFVSLWNNETCTGMKGESVSCPKENSGLAGAFSSMGDVALLLAGHDHDNDYCGSLPSGITLCYGRKTGFGCYGPPQGWTHGARVVLLRELPFSFETWIRDETGTKIVQAPHSPTGPGQTTCQPYS